MKRQNPQASVPYSGAGVPGGSSSIPAPEGLLQDGVFECFRCAQTHNGLGLDLDRLAGRGVAAQTRLAMRLDGAADAGNYELPRALGLFHSQLEQFVEESHGLLLGNGLLRRAYLLSDGRNNLGLATRICIRIRLASPVKIAWRACGAGRLGDYSDSKGRTQVKPSKKPDKTGLSGARHFSTENLLRGKLLVEERHGLDSAEIIFQSDMFVGCVRIFVRQSEAQQHTRNFECVVHLRDERNGAA